MIEGLKVTVNGAELVLLCKDRALFHLGRAEKYQLQIMSMKQNAIEGMNYTNGDPVKALQDKCSCHESEALELQFIAEHLIPTEQYLLGRDDLVKLGITKSRY